MSTREEYEREVYDHERQRGEHAETSEPFGERYELLFKRYTLRVMLDGIRAEDEDALEDVVNGAVSEAEENISDLLPEGYYCKIEEA